MSNFVEEKPQNLCIKCGKCCILETSPKAYEELVNMFKGSENNILELFEPTEAEGLYKCKHLLANNLCAIYNQRPNFCKKFPSSPWTILPNNCGFSGFSFQEREKIKREVRIKKEFLIELDVFLKLSQNQTEKLQALEEKKKAEDFINLYAAFGSKDW